MYTYTALSRATNQLIHPYQVCMDNATCEITIVFHTALVRVD